MTGHATRHGARHRGVAGDGECRSREARRAELEATGVHIRRGVTARAVAVETADREVIAGRADDRDVGEGPGDRRTVASETPGHALVCAGDRVSRVIACGRMALGAGRRGWNVVRWLAAAGLVGDE